MNIKPKNDKTSNYWLFPVNIICFFFVLFKPLLLEYSSRACFEDMLYCTNYTIFDRLILVNLVSSIQRKCYFFIEYRLSTGKLHYYVRLLSNLKMGKIKNIKISIVFYEIFQNTASSIKRHILAQSFSCKLPYITLLIFFCFLLLLYKIYIAKLKFTDKVYRSAFKEQVVWGVPHFKIFIDQTSNFFRNINVQNSVWQTVPAN